VAARTAGCALATAEADPVALQRDGQAGRLGDAGRQHLDEAQPGVGDLGAGRVDHLAGPGQQLVLAEGLRAEEDLEHRPGGQHLVAGQQVRRFRIGPVEAVLDPQRGVHLALLGGVLHGQDQLAGDRLDLLDHRGGLLARQADRAQHLVALQVDDEAALRQDGDAPPVEGRTHAVEQPRAATGHPDHRDAGVPAGRQRRPGAGADLAVGGEQRAVEVAGDQLGPPGTEVAELDDVLRPGAGGPGAGQHARPVSPHATGPARAPRASCRG
jgi:hypothetical protein